MSRLDSPFWRYNPSGRATASFSLIEVLFAIGIFSFCIITLIFLLGMGLLSSHRSQADSALAAALGNLDSHMRSLTASDITNSATYPASFYFDSDGNLLADANNSVYRGIVRRVTSVPSGEFSLALNDTTNYVLLTVEFSYPAPVYATTNQMILGRALHGSGIANFYE